MGKEKITMEDVCFVAAKEKYDFLYDGIERYGFQILIPYKDTNLFFRILRELWFRLGLPRREIWFHKELKEIKKSVIIVKDSLVCPELLAYLKKLHPKSRLVVMYFNRVHTTFPAEEAARFADELWSYDEDDCRKYHMKHMGYYYFQTYQVEKSKEPAYDLVYIGRDKGRAGSLLELERGLQKMGLRTYFHISPDRSFYRFRRRFYKPTIPYQQYLKILGQTKALLNIMPAGQRSITPRDMEVIFHGVKGVTNNLGILDFPFYHPDRYFVLGKRSLEELPSFLLSPFPEVEKEALDGFAFDRMVLELLNR